MKWLKTLDLCGEIVENELWNSYNISALDKHSYPHYNSIFKFISLYENVQCASMKEWDLNEQLCVNILSISICSGTFMLNSPSENQESTEMLKWFSCEWDSRVSLCTEPELFCFSVTELINSPYVQRKIRIQQESHEIKTEYPAKKLKQGNVVTQMKWLFFMPHKYDRWKYPIILIPATQMRDTIETKSEIRDAIFLCILSLYD